MGLRGDLSPDPSNHPEENFSHGHSVNIMPVVSSSDDEEDGNSYEGYEVLPQDFIESNTPQDDNESQESSDDGNVDITPINIRELPSFDRATNVEITELWNSNNNRITDIIIDSVKEEQIKNAMAGFKLPSTAIPTWAKQIPEEEWKGQLINRVNLLNKVTPV